MSLWNQMSVWTRLNRLDVKFCSYCPQGTGQQEDVVPAVEVAEITLIYFNLLIYLLYLFVYC